MLYSIFILLVCLIFSHFISWFWLYQIAKIIDKKFDIACRFEASALDKLHNDLDLLFRCNTQVSDKLVDFMSVVNDQLFFTKEDED
jgi:hypothetical protein